MPNSSAFTSDGDHKSRFQDRDITGAYRWRRCLRHECLSGRPSGTATGSNNRPSSSAFHDQTDRKEDNHELTEVPHRKVLCEVFIQRNWFSGKILRCHRGALGSIPRLRIALFFSWYFLVVVDIAMGVFEMWSCRGG